MNNGRLKMARRVRSIFYCLSTIALFASGCAVKQPPPPDAVSHAPLVVDEAMQQRQWRMSVAQYANGDTAAGPTGFIFVNKPDAPVWTAALTDTPIFMLDTVTCPIVFFCTPPWQTVVYPRGVTEPSYNVMPPLPE